MRIKVYIVTYRNDNALNQCLCHLYESDAVNYDLSTHIVNNYGILRDINIDNENIYPNQFITAISKGLFLKTNRTS